MIMRLYQNLNYPILEHRHRQQLIQRVINKLANYAMCILEKDTLIALAQAVKEEFEGVIQYADWNNRDDIKSTMKVDLIMLLAKQGYPPVDRNEVYKEVPGCLEKMLG